MPSLASTGRMFSPVSATTKKWSAWGFSRPARFGTVIVTVAPKVVPPPALAT